MPDGFVVRVGLIALDLADAAFPILVPGSARPDALTTRRLALVQDGRRPEQAERFSPLVCLAVPRGACLEAIGRTIGSLEAAGRYDGHYMLVTETADRPQPKGIDPRWLLYRHDPGLSVRVAATARLDQGVAECFRPVMCLTIGQVVEAPVEPMLHKLMRTSAGSPGLR